MNDDDEEEMDMRITILRERKHRANADVTKGMIISMTENHSSSNLKNIENLDAPRMQHPDDFEQCPCRSYHNFCIYGINL